MVAQLSELFGVDIDVLTSVNMEAIAADHWAESFRENLSAIIPNVGKENAAAGIDTERISEVAQGYRPISLENTCDIAFSLGRSVDNMVGNKNAASENEDDRIRLRNERHNCADDIAAKLTMQQ